MQLQVNDLIDVRATNPVIKTGWRISIAKELSNQIIMDETSDAYGLLSRCSMVSPT